MAGLTRITPEMTKQFTFTEKLAAALGAYFSIFGLMIVLGSFIGFVPLWKKAYWSWRPLPVVTDLELVSQLHREAPVDVEISVDFDEAVKMTTWKKGFYVMPVKGFEEKVFFYRERGYFEGEGKEKPIRVVGRAGKKVDLGWGVPGLKESDVWQLAERGLKIPDDAEILYEVEPGKNDLWNRYGLPVLGLLTGVVILNFTTRVFRAIRMIGNPRLLAHALNERLGFD